MNTSYQSLRRVAFLGFVVVSSASAHVSKPGAKLEHRPLSPIKLAEDDRLVDDAALKVGVTSADPAIREATAIAYGRILKPAGINPLLGLLHDANPRVKNAAIFALGQFGWSKDTAGGREKEISDAVLSLASATDPLATLAAIEAAGKLFNPATQATLVGFLGDSNGAIRDQALVSLAQMISSASMRGETDKLVPVTDAAISRIGELLKSDRHNSVRIHAAYLIYRLKDKRANAAVLLATKDSTDDVRYFAAQALSRTSESGKDDALAALLKLAKDRHANIRTEAVVAAGKLGLIHKFSDALFSAVLKDKSFHVREAFATALGADASVPDDALIALETDSSRMVRAVVVSALAVRRKTDSLPILTDALRDSACFVRLAAVDSSTALGASREPFLMEAAKNSEPLVTSEAIQALGEIDTPAAKARVNDALKSSILSEREAAASVVSTRKDADRFAMLYACYEDSLADPKWWDLRGGLLGEFVKENSSETTAYLHAALADPVPTIAYSAYGELSKRGDRSLPKMSAPELPRTVDSLLVFAKNPRLHVETTQGEFTIELFPQYAQIHVATIVGFALKGGYDGLPWHRVVSDFVVQGGDPDKTGYGSGPYPIRAEINPLHYQRGSVGMPRSSEWDSGGFQMFITHVPTPNLDGLYTIFGQVTHGMDVVDQLEPGDVMTKVSVDWVD